MTGALPAWLSAPAPVRSPAGHAAPYAETAARLEPLLARIPVTRVHDATALDRLGVPVWAAVTPLAVDLTVHAGKGLTGEAARISAVMEAIERVSAESLEAPAARGTFARLRVERRPVLDPLLFDPPFGFACDRWVDGHDLLTGQPCLVPRDLVVSPGPHGPDTNGLAAGNLPVEATLHALLEIIERDAAALRHVTRWYGEDDTAVALRLVDPATLPPAAADLCARLTEARLTVSLEDLTCDTGVPVFRTRLVDRAFPAREGQPTAFEGLGADLDPELAIMRALTEAAQAHTGVLLGARDAFEGETGPRPSRARALRWLGTRSLMSAFPSLPSPPQDLRARLAVMLERLRAAGFTHCPVIDLTRADLGIPVVRVLLAGAAGLYPETPRRPAARLLRALL